LKSYGQQIFLTGAKSLETVGIFSGIFTQLSPEYRHKLEQIASEVTLKKGRQLFAPGDPSRGFYVVREGAVRVYGMSPQGKEITQEIADQGSAFALASPFSGTYHCFAEALTDSRVYLIKKQEFLDLVTGDIRFASEWMRLLSQMVIQLRRRVVDLTLRSPKVRIANYLLLLADMQNSLSITLPVPRKELAAFLGMTHETFYRAAKELANDDLVRFTGQKVDILDRELLAEMTE
jgi:CRP-like cAMP-binding protein